MITNPAEVLAYKVCISHGNHNNADRFEALVLKCEKAVRETRWPNV